MKCERCKGEFPDNEIHSHHIIPKSIGGTNLDGRIYLCKKCHDIIHFSLLKVVFPYIEDEYNAKVAIKSFTDYFLKGGINK